MTENDRHMYNAHLQLLHAHLGEKSTYYTQSFMVYSMRVYAVELFTPMSQ